MIRRLIYIVMILLLSVHLSYANASPADGFPHALYFTKDAAVYTATRFFDADTTKVKRVPQNRMEMVEHGAIKEVARAKRQPKPEKITTPADTTDNKKQRSRRRPDGMERPPDIIRRNNN